MTDERAGADTSALVADLDKLYAKTTPGEWTADEPDDCVCMTAWVVEAKGLPAWEQPTTDQSYFDFDPDRTVAITALQYPRLANVPCEQWEPNARFIAAVHNAWREIANELTRLRSENARLQKLLDKGGIKE